MFQLTKEELLAISLAKNGMLGEKEESDLTDIDFEQLFKIIDSHSINMIAFDGISNQIDKLPSDVYNKWIYMASRKMTIFEELLYVHKKLTDILEQNGIKYFIFKGLCAGSYYYKPELREYGDIDFFVEFKDFKFAHKVLIDNGFKLISTDNKHWHYSYNQINIEMHFDFWDVPDNECGAFIKKLLHNSINSTNRYTIDNYSFNGPNPVVHATILILHIVNHLQIGGIGLRHLCDFAVFLNSKAFYENHDKITEVLSKGGLLKTTQIVSDICFKYFKTPDFKFMDNFDKDLSEMLILDIVSSGNFGRLSENVYYGSSIFTMKKYGNNGFFNAVAAFCRGAWKPCEKHKILLPIAPFVIAVRYVFRVITGNRPKISPVKFTKSGLKRSKLYKQFDFFEVK